jgi:hypothetical protein
VRAQSAQHNAPKAAASRQPAAFPDAASGDTKNRSEMLDAGGPE